MHAALRFVRTNILQIRHLLHENDAVAAIEMALILPVLLILGLGGMEITLLVLAHSRINQVGLSVADNASRIGGTTGTVREYDIAEVFTGAQLQLQGMPFAQKGRIILSSLERKSNGNQWIHWQRCYGSRSFLSSFGNASQDLGASGMGPTGQKVKAPADSAVMFVEIVYDHEPVLVASLFGRQRISGKFAFNVREARDLNAGNNTGIIPTSGVPAATC